jgi:hypothetical protein
MAKKKAGHAPTGMTLHAYQVGFGDCFLLSFHYKSARDRHVLIDFGSTGLPKAVPKNQMTLIAQDIATVCGGTLDAVVLSHRHRDHMSGFATTAKRNGPGDIIRGLGPKLVVQPWTEDPKAKKSASEPTATPKGDALKIASLEAQRLAVQHVVSEAQSLAATGISEREHRTLQSVRDEGMEGILNESAVKNLQSMAPADKHRYVFHGSSSGLGSVLPGVKVSVLGPPTLKQSSAIKKERSSDPVQFWMLEELDRQFWTAQAKNDRFLTASPHSRGKGPFPNAKVVRDVPFYARWFIPRARAARANELLGIVRILDKEMNNTSVILLFEIGSARLLFPGDAQIENWDLTLQDRKLMKRLAGVTLYKVGHHGSRNATPKTLWQGFTNRSKRKRSTRLRTVVSTMAGKFGAASRHTEVPRATLVTALKTETDLFTTQELTQKGHTLKKTIEFTF